MKIITSIFIIIFINVNLFAQINMVIKKTDNSKTSIPISEIDSVYYGSGCGMVTDYDGNIYQTIIIGTQCWMKEDLKVTHYPNGDPIPNITDNTVWDYLQDNKTDDAYCFYNNDNTTDYGGLYTYAAAIGDNWERDNSNGQGVCPDGWHLPTDAEWTILTDYLGGENIAGGKMKEIGTIHWISPNTDADNSSGFTGLPGGYRYYDNGPFNAMGEESYWWTATVYDSYRCDYRKLSYNYATVNNFHYNMSCGFSVRCVRN